MNRGKRGKTVTTSPLTRKVSTPSLSKGLLVVTHKVGGVVEILDVVPPIPLRAVSSPTNEVFYRAAFTFFHYLLVKQTVHFEGFDGIGVTVDGHGGWHVRAGAIEGIVGRGRCWLQLSHRENRMHSPIRGNIQLVRKSTYLLKYTKRADVLLGELLRNAGGGRDGVTLM